MCGGGRELGWLLEVLHPSNRNHPWHPIRIVLVIAVVKVLVIAIVIILVIAVVKVLFIAVVKVVYSAWPFD